MLNPDGEGRVVEVRIPPNQLDSLADLIRVLWRVPSPPEEIDAHQPDRAVEAD